MDYLAEGDGLKFRRAKEQLRGLDLVIQRFLQREPYALAHNLQNEGDLYQCRFYIQVNQPPWRISVQTGEVCHSLRTALDNLFWLLLTNNPKGRPVYFPIFNDEIKFVKDTAGYEDLVDLDVWESIKSLQPFKTGDDTLFVLHELDRINKHRSIPIVGSTARTKSVRWHGLQPLRFNVRRNIPLEQDAEYAVFDASQSRDESEVELEAEFRVIFVFGNETAIARGVHVQQFLHKATIVVQAVIQNLSHASVTTN